MLQRQLAESQRLLDVERSRYESIETSLRNGLVRFDRKVQPGELDMGTVCLESQYLKQTEIQLEKQKQRVEAQDRRVAEDLNALLQASMDRKALEKLKENMQLTFHRELAQKEQNRSEEAAITRHLLRQMGDVDIS